MTTTTWDEANRRVTQSVIDDAKWIVWHTSTAAQKATVLSLGQRGAEWYAMGTGWVCLADFDRDLGNSVLVDTQVGRWQFTNEAKDVWHGPSSWDWRKAWGWVVGTKYDRHFINA
jgi:hypothetical protein